MKQGRLFSFALVVIMTASIMAGCNGEGTKDPKTGEGEFKVTDKPITLTYARALWTDDLVTISNWNENETFKKMEELTNVKLEFIDVNYSNYNDYFTSMWASGNLPDLVEPLVQYPGGGIYKALEDGLVLDLTELIPEFAPDYQKARTTNDNMRRLSMSDNGKLAAFYMLQTIPQMEPSGFIIRQDWLDDLGFDMPNSISDLEKVLLAFKKHKKAAVPFCNYNNQGATFLMASFNFDVKMLQKDNKIFYGPASNDAKEYYKLMNTWYKQGLMGENLYGDVVGDPNSGRAGVWQSAWYNIAINTKNMTDPNAVLAPLPYFKDASGNKPQVQPQYPGDFGVSDRYVCIGAKTKYPQECVKYLNCWYTEKGKILANFGVEGISYELDANNKPAYLDIMKPDDKASFRNKQSKYFLHTGPFDRYSARGEGAALTFFNDVEEAANKLWSETIEMGYMLPPIVLPADKQAQIATIISELEVYAYEMMGKFINGEVPIDSGWDNYIQELKNKGMNEAVQAYQDAYDTFLKR